MNQKCQKTPKSEQNEQSDLKADAFIEGKNRQSSSQIYFLLEVKTITKIAKKGIAKSVKS